MLMAEQSVTVKQRAWWSKDLATAYTVTRYWRIQRSSQKTRINNDKQLQNIIDKLGPEVDVYQGDQNRKPSAQLRRAVKQLRSCRNNSFKLCQKFLEELAEEAAENDEKKTYKIVRSMKHTKARNIMYARMKRCLKPEDRGGITQIEVPEWDKCEFVLILGIGTKLEKVPQ